MASIQSSEITHFASTYNCTIEEGTQRFQSRDGTKYHHLDCFEEAVDKAKNGLTLRCGITGLDSRKPGFVEFFATLEKTDDIFTSILMSNSTISDEGARAIANYIIATKRLLVINFERSKVSEAGMEMIIGALKINTSIEFINLSKNALTPEIGSQLLDLVTHHNCTIRQMVISHKCPDFLPSSALDKLIPVSSSEGELAKLLPTMMDELVLSVSEEELIPFRDEWKIHQQIAQNAKEFIEQLEKLTAPSKLLGIDVCNLSPDETRKYSLPENAEGIVIVHVAPSSPAHQVGLRSGLLVTAINGRKVTNVLEFHAAFRAMTAGDAILIYARQGNRISYYSIKKSHS